MEQKKITTDFLMAGMDVEQEKSQEENSRYDRMRAYEAHYRRMKKDSGKGEMTYDE